MPPEQDPVFPTTSPFHQEDYTSLLAASIRGQASKKGCSIRSSKKNHNPTEARTKLHYRKLIRMKKEKVTPQMKRQDKTPERQLNEVEIGKLPGKEFRIMIVKMIQDLGKRMEKMQEMFTKDLQELKKKQR